MRPGDLLGPTTMHLLGPTTMHLECRVAGCGAAFEVPVQYRLTYLEGGGARVELDVDGTLALEAPLRVHLDEHATNGAPPPDEPPPDEPPPWQALEWCDAGATCEHPGCIDWREEQGEPCLCGHLEVDHDLDDGCGGCALHWRGPCRTYRPRSEGRPL